MKNALQGFAAAAVIAASVGAPATTVAAQSVDVVASNWKFTPNAITLHVGQPTTLRLTSSGGVHGLESADLGIPQTAIAPGSTKTITVTPKKAGKYVLHCAIMCGAGHANMTLTVDVVQ
ncbi:MAG: cupredoxin domain-containing protein [Candidatus Eremiobacteraeota bacterium]|nr:cupredoxin domain-containing protein [Candidatus Eremiobacteraeota bacterium]MBV9700820.1 cupredoxin domain-containing protein [Candidatus Eremiobacteraeota bacterium]